MFQIKQKTDKSTLVSFFNWVLIFLISDIAVCFYIWIWLMKNLFFNFFNFKWSLYDIKFLLFLVFFFYFSIGNNKCINIPNINCKYTKKFQTNFLFAKNFSFGHLSALDLKITNNERVYFYLTYFCFDFSLKFCFLNVFSKINLKK